VKQKIFIKTYGCQMNVYDSARMTELLEPLGYQVIDRPDGADLIILNTCHIREKAAEKVYSELGRLRVLQRNRPHPGTDAGEDQPKSRPMIAVAGCVAQAEGEEIFRRDPSVDIVVGPQAYHRLPELIARATRAAGRALDTDFPAEPKFDRLVNIKSTTRPGSAFVTVQEGCDKFCSFCVVPYTRGAEYSRPVQDVLAEVSNTARLGAKEITLLGQNVNNYHGAGPDGETWRLGRLITAIAELEGVHRIRYTTSYPADMDDALVAAHRDIPQLMPFLHLPVQSGSNRILTAMNRRHSAEDYLRICDKLRAARGDLALSSDFIVGYPGETDQDFRETMRLVEAVRFAQAFSFKYSPRPGTPAASEAQVPDKVKSERLAELQSVLNDQQRQFNDNSIGQDVDILFEKTGRKAGQMIGRSPYLQAVHAQAPEALLGQICPVHITSSSANSLGGTLLSGAVQSAALAG